MLVSCLDSSKTILMLHSRYKLKGGEENSFEAEARLFQSQGYSVKKMVIHNSDAKANLLGAVNSVFNLKQFFKLMIEIRKSRPELIYANNLWPSYSSSPLAAARLWKIPVLQAARNYRLVYPSAKLTAIGACTECGNSKSPWRCVIRGCYNGSSLQSAVVLLSSTVNRTITYGWRQHRYLATSQTTKDLLVQKGLPSKRISVRPNFKDEVTKPSFEPGSGVIYVGRLSKEKGILEVISAWPNSTTAPILTLVGDGPLRQDVIDSSLQNRNIRWIGQLDQERVASHLKNSVVAIIPSTWAEPFGRVAIEAMSVGTPVACSEGGALQEIVGETGFILKNLDSNSILELVSLVESGKTFTKLRAEAYTRFCEGFTMVQASENLKDRLIEVGLL